MPKVNDITDEELKPYHIKWDDLPLAYKRALRKYDHDPFTSTLKSFYLGVMLGVKLESGQIRIGEKNKKK